MSDYDGVLHPIDRLSGSQLGDLVLVDLDRTLYPGSSLKPLASALFKRGLVSRTDMASALIGDIGFRRRGVGDSFAQRVCEKALGCAAGRTVDEMDAVVDDVAREVVVGARWQILQRVAEHRRNGAFCVLLSASPHDLVTRVANLAGLHRGVGTMPEVVEGRFTGKLVGEFCYGSGKLARLRQALGDVDLSRAWAYADSESDIVLMEQCGNPVAVSPSKALRASARKRGWEIVDADEGGAAG